MTTPSPAPDFYTIGFLTTVVGFIPAYIAGIAIANRMNRTL